MSQLDKLQEVVHNKMSKLNKGMFLIIGILSVVFLYTRNSILEPIIFFLLAVVVLMLVIEKFKNKEYVLTGIYSLVLFFDLYVFFQVLMVIV